LIALAGPAVNFVIAATLYCFLVLLAGTTAGLTGSLGVFVFELMIANLALGLFNLIPAFPMDGGRVLRAALSTGVGRAQATRIAARIGRILAVVFVVAITALTGAITPISLALAAFIFFAARNEEAHVLYEERRRAAVQGGSSQGMWTAPPGYRWVHRGNGLWQLAPMRSGFHDHAAQDATAWR
jgi:Zn-dependent protease